MDREIRGTLIVYFRQVSHFAACRKQQCVPCNWLALFSVNDGDDGCAALACLLLSRIQNDQTRNGAEELVVEAKGKL